MSLRRVLKSLVEQSQYLPSLSLLCGLWDISFFFLFLHRPSPLLLSCSQCVCSVPAAGPNCKFDGIVSCPPAPPSFPEGSFSCGGGGGWTKWNPIPLVYSGCPPTDHGPFKEREEDAHPTPTPPKARRQFDCEQKRHPKRQEVHPSLIAECHGSYLPRLIRCDSKFEVGGYERQNGWAVRGKTIGGRKVFTRSRREVTRRGEKNILCFFLSIVLLSLSLLRGKSGDGGIR